MARVTAKKAVAKKAAPAKKTAVAKKAAPAKKGVVLESWTKGYLPFTDAVREHFGFLVSDHGFDAPEVEVEPPSAVVTFRRGTGLVRVESEYVGEPFTLVRTAEGKSFGLPVIMAELDPEHAAKQPVSEGKKLSSDELRASVAHQADFVKKHAGEILWGDPALLARFEARRDAMRQASA